MTGNRHIDPHRHAAALATGSLAPITPVSPMSTVSAGNPCAARPIQRAVGSSQRQPRNKTRKPRSLPTEHGNQLSP